MNYLREHFRESILLPALAYAVKLSPRSLRTAIREHIGHSVTDELTRLRLAEAARLLRETEMKLESVAHESGITSAKYLWEVFRPAFGQTPVEYREKQRATRGAGGL